MTINARFLNQMKVEPTEKGSKFKNKIVNIGGQTYHSMGEYKRECCLKQQLRSGIIKNLKRQVTFKFEVNGVHICEYIADWTYTIVEGNIDVVEDFKGIQTDTFKIKKKLMKACHGIDVWVNKSINANCLTEYPL